LPLPAPGPLFQPAELPETEPDLRPWPEKFLSALEETGNVSAAARSAGIHRDTAYALRASDAGFASAWSAALEIAVESLELEARRRALDGCIEPVFYQGGQCGWIRRYSDTLMVFLLKAHRPEKYRENVHAEHSGEITVRVEYDDPTPPAASGPAPLPAGGEAVQCALDGPPVGEDHDRD
jgi:hypothetical protein